MGFDSGEAALVEVDVKVEGPNTVISLAGELDLISRREFWHEMKGAAAQTEGDVIVDVAGLRFLDAAGLRAITEADRILDGRLVVRSPSPAVRRVLEVTGLDKQLRLRPAPTKADYVRTLWHAFLTSGPTAMADLVPEHVEWVPWQSGGRRLRGSGEMRDFWSRHAAPTVRAAEFTERGSDVLVRFEMPLPGGKRKELWSVCHFEGDQLVQAITVEHRPRTWASAA